MEKHFIYAASALALLAFINPALAQNPQNADTNTPRVIPTLGTPVAIPVNLPAENAKFALLTLALGLDAGVLYESNIYRAPRNEQSDMIAVVAPTVALKSNLVDQKITFSFTPEIGRYKSETKNNYEDWTTRLRLNRDMGLSDNLNLDAEYGHSHVAIGGFEDDPTLTLREPTEYDFMSASGLWKGFKDLFHYRFGANFDSYDYDNVLREDGSLSVQDDRDRDIYELTARFGYEFVPAYVFYMEGSWNTRNYDKRIDSSLLYTRDSDGQRASIGVYRDITGLPLTFDASIGYLGQSYDATELPDVDALDYRLTGKWRVSPMDTLTLHIRRDVKDSSVNGVSGALQTQSTLDLTRVYNDSLSYGAKVGYMNADYESNVALAGVDREDNIYDAGLHAQYAIGQHSALKLEYDYRDRESNRALTDYTDHTIGQYLVMKP